MSDPSASQVLVDRVDSITCSRCGKAVDLADVKPLTSIDCPHCGAAVAVPGKIGQFMLTRVMGAGAMGAVFQATDTMLGRRVAVKVMRRQEGDDAKKAQLNFLREARALASVNHRNVVQVHTIGQHKGQPYIVMELIDGKERLEDLVIRNEPLDEKRVLEIGRDVAEGLSMAWRMKLVHGDIKPGNILIAADGTAKVVDFGLVRRGGKADDDEPVWGTPYYIAPERIKGQPPDAYTDIYSLGATLWHLLVGRPPFEGSTIKKVLSARLDKAPPDVAEAKPGISSKTAHVLRRMMAVDPKNRYRDYETVIDRIDKALAALEVRTIARASRPIIHEARKSQRISPPQLPSKSRTRTTTRRKRKSSPKVLILAIACLLLIVGLVGFTVFMLTRHGAAGSGPSKNAAASANGFFTADFAGPKLPAAFSHTGEGSFNNAGAFTLPAGVGPSPTNRLYCNLPPGSFDCTFRVSPLDGSIMPAHPVAEFVNPDGGGLKLALVRNGDQVVVLRATVLKAPGDIIKTADARLPYDPDAVNIRVTYDAAGRSWYVRWALGATSPIDNHPIGRVNMPADVPPPNSFTFTVLGASHPGQLTVGLDRFALEPVQ